MEKIEYIIWSSSPDTSEAGINRFCELNAGRYERSPEETKALPLSKLLPLMWNDIQSWRLTAHEALKVPTPTPILVIADRAGNTPLSKPERSCFVFSGESLNQIFEVRQGLSTTFFSDGANIRCTDITENGADHYLFRELTNTNGLQSFVQRVSDGAFFTESELDQFSCSLAPIVHKIYGWPDPKKSPLDVRISEAQFRTSADNQCSPKEKEFVK